VHRSHLFHFGSCAFLIISTFALYSGVRQHDFVWDTIQFLLENPWVHDPGPAELLAMFTEVHRANWQPLIWISHAIDFRLFGNDAGLHHLSNVAYHAIDCCLVYWLVLKIMDHAGQKPSAMIALMSAFIFLAHPQHVQSVAWLVERKDTLSVLFSLLMLIFWLRQSTSAGRFAPLVFFILALMSKPMAVTLPVILVLLDIYPLNRYRSIRDIPRLVIEKWPYFALSFCVGILTLTTQQIAMVKLDDLPVWVRFLNAINNSLFYVQGYLWPANLSPFYPYAWNINAITTPVFWLPGLVFLLASSTATIYLWRQQIRWPGVSLLFYLVTLAPVSGVIHVGPAKALDYYVYLATLPIGVLVSVTVFNLIERLPRYRSIFAALAIFYCGTLVLLAKQNITIWQNEFTLWSRAYQLHPESAYINRNLAAAFVSMGEFETALRHAELSVQYGSRDKQYLEKLRAFVESSSIPQAVPQSVP